MLHGSYDYRFVALSVVLAICASYAALDLAARVATSRGWAQKLWLIGGASAMGSGIWSMHYVGMVAFRLSIPVWYDWPTVVISLLAAIVASAAALHTGGGKLELKWTVLRSVVMGAGIAAMHYVGMYAMRMRAICEFNPLFVTLSVILAVAISFIALWLFFLSSNDNRTISPRKLASAIAMGTAIPMMHYSGMAAARFTVSDRVPDLSHAVGSSVLSTLGIVIVTIMILGIAILTTAHSRLMRESQAGSQNRILIARIITTRTALITLCVMSAFEAAKQALHPTITIWTSHIVTILLTTLLSVILSLMVLRKEDRFQMILDNERKMLRALIDNIPDFMYVKDRQNKFLIANAHTAQMLGADSVDELLGKTDFDFFPRELAEAYCADEQEVMRSERPLFNREEPGRDRQGNRTHILTTKVPLRNAGGAIVGIAGVGRDVTARRLAEEALRQSETQYRLLFDNNPLPMWVFDRQTLQFLAVNEAAIQHYGFSLQEFLAMTIAEIRPEEDIPDLLNATARRIHGLQEPEIWRHRKKNGTIIYVEIVAHELDFHGIEAELVAAQDITERRRAEQTTNLLAAIVDSSEDAIISQNLEGLISSWNKAAERLFGYRPEQAIGKNITLIVPPDRRHEEEMILDQLRRGECIEHFETVRARKDGTLLDVALTISPVKDRAGRVLGVSKLARDISERKKAEEALRCAEEKYRAIFEDTVVGIFQITPEGRPLSINRALAQMHGYDSPEELLRAVSNLTQELYVDASRMDELSRVMAEKGVVRGAEMEICRKDGTRKWVLMNLRAVRDTDGKIVLHEGTVEDITDRKFAEERVKFLAYYDALTGLPNRTLLHDRIEKALASARRRREKVGLLFLDLDRFKNINDSLGHSSGDRLLQDVGNRLKNWAREQDTVARLGGDEFLVVLTAVKDTSDIAVAAERLMDVMTAEFVIQDRTLNVSCSLGISVFPEHGTDAETLIKNADAAMYTAKDNGRDNFRFFTKEMNAQVVERLTMENSLRRAIEQKELFLMYQPQMDIATGRITGLEALLRWQHPELGLVPPDRFIRIAENSGLIMPIGEWVLKTACLQSRKWQRDGLPAVPVAVNVSAVQFRQDGFAKLIASVLKESGLPAGYLELELTESLLLSNADVMFSVLDELKAMGLKLAIDDFGTGYSSFSYLKQFPVSKLKIDRSFIRDIPANADDAAITTAIISMAKNLNLKVTAEGVETEAQISFLRARSCDEIQGYYFSKPLSADQVVEKIRSTEDAFLAKHEI